ncbi:MAG TPA: lactate racemase domain-containing protein [Trueperaceae bacterium]|nr:lactate racemase domain-containing protein [Trueperaceae bacterium]
MSPSGSGYLGDGSVAAPLPEDRVRGILEGGLGPLALDGRRVLVIIPDGTRSAPIALFYRLLHELLGARVAALDYLIALGTHPPMSEEAIARLVGLDAEERARRTPESRVFNHAWQDEATLVTVGTIDESAMDALTGGLVTRPTPVRLNRMIRAYDHLLILGPVFPHEVAGFSGGAKYLFPGIAGPDIIDNTHWLGALATSHATIGVKDTAVRRVLHRAAEFVVAERPVTLAALVMQGKTLHGLYLGDHVAAWEAAADLSAELNIVWKPHAFRSVLSMPSAMYGELWTAAKAMYKTEPVIADGGEVIIYAPELKEISTVHGHLIRQVGYHVRDYFTAQWDRFEDLPWAILAHSTHVKGGGSFEGGVERPRIRVTLATGIPEAVCRQVDLGYRDPASIDPDAWRDREDEGRLLVEHAGEHLFRLRGE